MPYEIPQSLKYEEKIVFNLSFKQLFWLGGFGGLATLVFFKSGWPELARLVASLVLVALGFGFGFFNLASWLSDLWRFKGSLRGAGYLDLKSNGFVGVEKIEKDALFLKNGGLRAVIQVQPINFFMLGRQEQEAVISAYRDFLNSLDFPVQVVVRTVNLNLDDYLSGLGEDVKGLKSERLMEQFSSFQDFVKGFIEENAVKNRLFYVVVPFDGGVSFNVFKDLFVGLTNLFRKNKKKDSFDASLESALSRLKIRVDLCREQLKKCNLLTYRLNDAQLTSLLASFFEGFVEADNDYFFPVTLLEKFKESDLNGEEIEERKWFTPFGEEVGAGVS